MGNHGNVKIIYALCVKRERFSLSRHANYRFYSNNLNVKGLAGGMLAKSVTDAGWSTFFGKLAYKHVLFRVLS